MEFISGNKTIPNDVKEVEIIIPKDAIKKVSDLPVNNDQGHRPISISITAGPTAWTGRFDAKSNATLYLIEKHQPLPVGWNAALMMEYALSEKWNLSVGIHHTYLNLKYDLNYKYEKAYTQVDSIVGVIQFPFDPPIPFTVYDTNNYVMTKTALLQYEMRIHSTDIAVQAARLFKTDKFMFRLGLGALLNVSNKVNVPEVPVAEGEKDVILTDNNLFERKWDLGLIAGGEMSFKLNNSLSPFVSIAYAKYINDAMKESSPFHLYISQLNAGVGIRISFTK